jgi:Domain of unknown function (DUF5668)
MTAYRPETLALGLSLIALGVLWTLANLGALDLLATLRTWWPVSLIVWGVLELMATLARRSERGL